jgi:RNA polymerase sigma-70 factor (ECF subfamily)
MEDLMGMQNSGAGNPHDQLFRHTMIQLLERAIETIPEKYRVVFVLRDAEGLNTEETAQSLGISTEAVKTRLHRARTLLRKELEANAGVTVKDIYSFAGHRCDRIVANVMQRIHEINGQHAEAQRTWR